MVDGQFTPDLLGWHNPSLLQVAFFPLCFLSCSFLKELLGFSRKALLVSSSLAPSQRTPRMGRKRVLKLLRGLIIESLADFF